MQEKIINKLKNKKIALLGFGKEGKSTYNFIRKNLPNQELIILDKNPITLKDNYVTVITGDKYLENLDCYDLIIKSPGISLNNLNLPKISSKITSQLELILEVYKENIIGITGTKGKSTTSSLIYQILKNQNKDVYLLGNIGNPIFDELDKFKKETILVIEMSSHQLEYIKYSPHIALILNLYEDHLDHAGNLEHYHANKMNIFKYQSKKDYAIYAEDNYYLAKRIKDIELKANKYTIRMDNLNKKENSFYLDNNKVYLNDKLLYIDDKRKLIGEHNLKNIIFALAITIILKLDLEKATSTIKNFTGLKYRMEYIGSYNDVEYYCDTIATIPEATMNAIKALKTVDTLIFGGLDRKISYKDFITFLKNSTINNFICMPSTAHDIGKILKKETTKNVYLVETLEEAVKVAKEKTAKFKICLLSPAAASYEYYKNYEEKGKKFEELIKENNI